jgi:hypothetical protein
MSVQSGSVSAKQTWHGLFTNYVTNKMNLQFESERLDEAIRKAFADPNNPYNALAQEHLVTERQVRLLFDRFMANKKDQLTCPFYKSWQIHANKRYIVERVEQTLKDVGVTLVKHD